MNSNVLHTRGRFIIRIFLLILLIVCLAAGVVLPVLAADQKGKSTPDTRVPFPKPRSHAGNWIEVHGRNADASMSPSGNACLVCHERTDCTACHVARPPRDHTNTWRTLSHGFMAEANRDRCLVCHKQDYCLRCHNETAPRSHTGTWTTRHCTWCHFSSGMTPGDNCGVCHRIAPHTTAPHAVNGSMNCNLCHR